MDNILKNKEKAQTVEFTKLLKACFDELVDNGVDTDIATHVSFGLCSTSLRGTDSHGVRLLSHYLKAFNAGRLNKSPRFKFENTSNATGILDADHTCGVSAGMVAMDHAMRLASENGIGAIAVRIKSCRPGHDRYLFYKW